MPLLIRSLPPLLAGLLGIVSCGLHADEAFSNESFSTWLSRNCLSCHSGLDPAGGLNLTSVDLAISGGESGAAWAPERPWESSIWQAIESGSMPPESPLSASEIQSVRSWIEQGKLWPDHPIDPIAASTDTRAGYDWWAFRSLMKLEAIWPDPSTTASGNSPIPGISPVPASSVIDVLVDQELEKLNLTRSPRADHRALARRVHYGVRGLPPTKSDLDDFQSNGSPDAYESLVDRLLDSPDFGERFGRYWLDLVRFGETNGFEYDEPRDNFWRYRNWVVQAMNEDMPYDQFVRMQLAGDAIRPADPAGAIATGFLVAGPHNTTLPVGNELVKLAMQEEETEELVGTIGQTFLGMTVNCARCHDHKFDPISQANYYEFAANFAGVAHGEKEVQFAASQMSRVQQQRIQKELELIGSKIESMRMELSEELEKQKSASYTQFSHLPEPVLQWPTPLAGKLSWDPIWKRVGASQFDTNDKGGIILDGQSQYLESAAPVKAVLEKTLSAWVKLDDLAQQGGGVLTLASNDERQFDSIVFAEQQPGEWLVGSEFFNRTRGLGGPAETIAETIAELEAVHIAATYREDGSIHVYRNGKPYGTSYSVDRQVQFNENEYQVLLGLRHKPAVGNRLLQGTIYYAALFDRALTEREIEIQASHDFLKMQQWISLGDERNADRVQMLNQLTSEQTGLQSELRKLNEGSKSKVYTSIGRAIGESRIYRRGEVGMPGEVVAPRPLNAINQEGDFPLLPGDASDQQRRENAAQWITSASNPLFARVIANRIWMYHMGSSLVETPSDFGFNGGHPTHPELLDYLAGLVIENGFRLKPVHRAVLLSQSYQQSAKSNEIGQSVDASNRRYWRKSPQRLEAEEVRDSLLAISNRLSLQRTGPGYRDMSQSTEKGTNVYRLLDISDDPVQQRTLYRFTTRGNRNPFLDNFDCPDPSVTTPKRSKTTTPLQALSLLNNSLIISVSRSLERDIEAQANRDSKSPEESVLAKESALIEGDTLAEQVAIAYQRVLLRSPTREEQIDALEFSNKHGIAGLCRILFNTNEFLYVQ